MEKDLLFSEAQAKQMRFNRFDLHLVVVWHHAKATTAWGYGSLKRIM